MVAFATENCLMPSRDTNTRTKDEFYDLIKVASDFFTGSVLTSIDNLSIWLIRLIHNFNQFQSSIFS